MTSNQPPYPGIVDYSSDPLLPPWYIPSWTNQNEKNVLAPVSPFMLSALPSSLTRIEITGNFTDGIGNPYGGYFTFETSAELLVTETVNNATEYWTIPAGLVGDIPASLGASTAWNQAGSGKIHLIYGQLDVVLLATDQSAIAPQAPPMDKYSITGATSTTPASWLYHVREYWLGGRMYDITVPSATTPVDINTLIVPGTIYLNNDWNRGY